ncbi:LANO_0E12090g1_1 [Lachancea nothofagi CBS 11611]|uniref:LANO_0E12090g1_1 n=1 Tax=Lachancea nothofagi CBS 11611 TaxID=1266666 RepID=A0A1G4JXU8_9SACH|nr:LANO_0E12090g1_1 [Lachancea nothofagi CBS 11611]
MPQVQITSSLCSTSREISLQWDWGHLCERLSELSGILAEDMHLEIEYQDGSKETVDKPQNRTGTLKQDMPKAPVSIVVVDNNKNSVASELAQEFANTDETGPGFQLSEEDYQRRADSALQWKKQSKLGEFDPQYRLKLQQDLVRQQHCASELTVNERCLVTGGPAERRGWLRYLGPLPAPRNRGTWCGVEFDEPCGKNDGSFEGRVLFGPVNPRYGGFVKPSCVKTSAEYQPIDEFEGLSDDDEL